MISQRAFPRRIDVLPDVVAFTDRALADASLGDAQRQALHFAIEELMTNMVKYAPEGAPFISLEIHADRGSADVLLVDRGVERFDPTDARDVRTDQPAALRQPGGLGLHLIRRTVDAFGYEYVAARREGRTSFRIGNPTGEVGHADD